MIDLDARSLGIVKKILKKHVPEYLVCAFGSRVTGQAKQYSDLDLVIMSEQPIPVDIINALKFEFSSSDLPILVDIVDWSNLSDEFRDKIKSSCEKL